MSASEYEKKRDFSKTREPKGGSKEAGEQPIFVIQKHDATNLHYDFRLEIGGSLKSWSVPKGPSTDPSVKRMAIPTEDHPMEYADFEGTIPEGEYGGGTVMIWDRGTFKNIKADKQGRELSLSKSYELGTLEVDLHGEKIYGGYALVRMNSGKMKGNWLLIKMNDDKADARRNPTSTENKSKRPEYGRNNGTNFGMKAKEQIRFLKEEGFINETTFPGFRPPMLATLTKEYFDNPSWVYERKLDGIRCMVLREGKKISLLSRNKKNLDATFPEFQEQLPSLSRADFIADGEIVAFDGKITSFSKLQERLPITNSYADTPAAPKVFLYLFDLLYFDGFELEQAPLTRRKQLLKECLSWSDPISYTPYRKEKGKKYLEEACRKGWEGLIAKNGQAPYTHNRSKQWLKFKCVNRQELVIGGFTDPKGGRQGFGALLVGYYRNGELLYAGKVGTGFNDDFLKEWGEKFKKKRRDTSPFADYSDSRNGRNHWIQPKFVGQFEFTEWTAAGKLRHPSFIGMRYDKEPENVIKETEDENS